ncbi:SNF2 helicase associated domain-containing protein [Sphingobacterium sp. DN00404]|uniref:SNF2 helicase associated domain-containing protein n=1 Tax=Sphingobacterium micropteri TaxID=2763501 RepID=A0ABR7YR51_9SPHI|nr:SNF2-related protein [Sphingobacterium micropteri]MBD1433681.1 SNF2 helicase associated domain-containing protein [Sphingobacterium micropteri]
MTELPKEYTLANTNIESLSVFELLKHTASGDFMEKRDFQHISAISLALNAGVFTKINVVGFPNVAVSQMGNAIISSCSCMQGSSTLCLHQAEIIYGILERKDYRIFFDKMLRHKTLLAQAKYYGLENEPHLDSYFQLSHQEGKLHMETRIKELLPMDEQLFRKDLLPKQQSFLKDLNAKDIGKKQLLVIGRHRYYQQLNFLLMEAAITQSGKIKNPIANIDPIKLVWKADDPQEIKFYTALTTFQQTYSEDHTEAESEALKLIVANPLDLEVYYHDRDISETVTAKSLLPVELAVLKAEIRLRVFKKEPFYEVTGELQFNDTSLPFKNTVIRHDYFVYHQQVFYFVDHPDMLRVIRFFKSNNEILLVHASKYDEFFQTVLAPLEELLHIDYSYIRVATPVQLAEKNFETEPIIYLHQEGNYISITPVMKYGAIEIPVYSQKQLLDTDQNGNEFKIERDKEAEERLTSVVMQQHPDFREQMKGHEYFYLHKDQFLDEDWFLEAFEVWRAKGITILGFHELKSNRLNPHRAKISIEVISGVDWFNAKLKVRFGKNNASLKQVYRAIRNKSKFVQLDDGTQGILPEEWITKISRYFQIGEIDKELLKIPKINFSEVTKLFEKDVLSAEVQTEILAYQTQFVKHKSFSAVSVPTTLQAQLRDYQREGLKWLNFLDNFNFGGCLADDMGLGKTLQIIAFILTQREKYGHTTNLVIVPTSLLFNWQEELSKFAPSVKTLLHYGAERGKSVEEMDQYEVVLTSYGMLLSDIRFLKTFRFNYIFLDESQAIKNPSSERYKAARLLQSRNRIVLTGTPMENNTFDLYGQLSFACPGLLGSKQYFRDTYALPIDKFEYNKRAVELQEKVRPFILRRTKKQVAKELPEKTEMIIYCEMNAEQRRIYDAYERELREFISATDESEIHKNSMHVLTGLTKLRQICNSPVLLKEGHSGDNAIKIEVLTEQIESQAKEHKILVFSQFVAMLDLIKAELERKDIPFVYLTGQTKDRGTPVKHFQTDEHVRVFLISLKAGGVGLNLTEADYVYLVDPWWNPAVENQAIDRSHRIGQQKNVVAVRLICSDTVEEKIVHLQKKKNKLAQALIKTDKSYLDGLSKQDLLEVLGFIPKKVLS